MPDRPRHASPAIREALLAEFQRLGLGGRLPPERDLAARFGASRATVSKVLTALEGEGLIVRRVGRGTFVSPHEGRPAAGGGDRVILAYPDFFSYAIWNRVRAIDARAAAEGLALSHVLLRPDADYGALLKRAENSPGLRGVALLDGVPFGRPVLERLDALGVPVAFVGTMEGLERYRNFRMVNNNHFLSGYQKLSVLARNGHRAIAMVNNEPPTPAWRENLRGVKAAARDLRLPWRQIAQPAREQRYWENPMEGGYAQTLLALRARPETTALLVDTFPGALGALRALYELGLNCPGQVSIATSLGMAGQEEYTCPKITTVEEDAERIGAIVLDILQGRAPATLREFKIDTVMRERESVRRLDPGEIAGAAASARALAAPANASFVAHHHKENP